jgi:hypothetical protein
VSGGEHTSGIAPSFLETRPESPLAAYLFKWEEYPESCPWASCTETMTSLAKYAIRATIQDVNQLCSVWRDLYHIAVSKTAGLHKGRHGKHSSFYSHHCASMSRRYRIHHLPASSGVRIWIVLLAIAELAAEDESALPKRNDMARVAETKLPQHY